MEPECSLPHSQEPSTRPYSEPDQSSPCPHSTSWRPILTFSSHLRLVLPNGLFSLGFPTKILYAPRLFPLHATYLANLILLDLIAPIIFGGGCISLRSSLCSFLRSLLTSSPLGPNILLSTLLSNTLSLRSSPQWQQPSFTPTQTTYKIIVLYILIFIFLDNNLEDRRFCTEL